MMTNDDVHNDENIYSKQLHNINVAKQYNRTGIMYHIY